MYGRGLIKTRLIYMYGRGGYQLGEASLIYTYGREWGLSKRGDQSYMYDRRAYIYHLGETIMGAYQRGETLMVAYQ